MPLTESQADKEVRLSAVPLPVRLESQTGPGRSGDHVVHTPHFKSMHVAGPAAQNLGWFEDQDQSTARPEDSGDLSDRRVKLRPEVEDGHAGCAIEGGGLEGKRVRTRLQDFGPVAKTPRDATNRGIGKVDACQAPRLHPEQSLEQRSAADPDVDKALPRNWPEQIEGQFVQLASYPV